MPTFLVQKFVYTLVGVREGRPPNYQRQFRCCPLWRQPEKRCDYFQWLEHQPYWRDPSLAKTKLTDEMRELNEEQRKCRHPIVLGTGSNGFQKKKTCKYCRLPLEVADAKTGKLI